MTTFRKIGSAADLWFRADLGNLLSSLDAIPMPDREYSAGWRDALTIGMQREKPWSGPGDNGRTVAVIDAAGRQLTQ